MEKTLDGVLLMGNSTEGVAGVVRGRFLGVYPVIHVGAKDGGEEVESRTFFYGSPKYTFFDKMLREKGL